MNIAGPQPHAAPLMAIHASDAMRPVGSRIGSALNPTLQDRKASPEEVAARFEGMLLEMMTRSMRKTVQTTELFGSNLGGQHYVEFLDSLYVEMAIERGGTEIREAILRQIEQAQGEEDTHPAQSNSKEGETSDDPLRPHETGAAE